jgi:uncharacterized membrane protein YkvI
LKKQAWLFAKVVTMYIGSVIGAGFASGQEIMQFFVLHGLDGIKGLLLMSVLFAYLGGYVMYLCTSLRSASYKDVFIKLIGRQAGAVMDRLNLCILLGSLSVMMAGSAAVFKEQFGLPPAAGTVAVLCLTALVLLSGLEGVLAATVVLVPLKFVAVTGIALAVMCLDGWLFQPVPVDTVPGGVAGNWLVSAFLYVSYNMVVPVAALSSLGRIVPRRLGIAGGITGGLLLGLAVSLVALALWQHLPDLYGYQIPMLYLAGRLGPGSRLLLALLIWLAILTTALAQAHGFASRLAAGSAAKYRIYGLGACLFALPLSAAGFSTMVRYLYPLFGGAGLILLLAIIAAPLAKK